jgi:hypothetical protein
MLDVASSVYCAGFALGAAGLVGWLLASAWVIGTCHVLTRSAPFHSDGSRGDHSRLAIWMRGRGVTVGSCIYSYARAEAYCGVLTAAGVSCAMATAVWECLASARYSHARQLADATDASAVLVSAIVTAAAALLYLCWRCVARLRAAHGGVVPFVMRRIGCVVAGAIRWHIDTTWTYITLQYFSVSDVDRLKDGRTIFDGVDMVRHRYGLHDDECYNYIFPCEKRHSGKLLRVRVCLSDVSCTKGMIVVVIVVSGRTGTATGACCLLPLLAACCCRRRCRRRRRCCAHRASLHR